MVEGASGEQIGRVRMGGWKGLRVGGFDGLGMGRWEGLEVESRRGYVWVGGKG